jgi:hypothetical protein
MSKMGQFVLECQTIAEEAHLDGDLEQKVEEQFADRPDLIRYATQTAKEILEDIPF